MRVWGTQTEGLSGTVNNALRLSAVGEESVKKTKEVIIACSQLKDHARRLVPDDAICRQQQGVLGRTPKCHYANSPRSIASVTACLHDNYVTALVLLPFPSFSSPLTWPAVPPWPSPSPPPARAASSPPAPSPSPPSDRRGGEGQGRAGRGEGDDGIRHTLEVVPKKKKTHSILPVPGTR